MDKKQRDELAKAAMQGILSHHGFTFPSMDLAVNAYIIADAMLAESERTCPACGAIRKLDEPLKHISGCEFGWSDAPLPREKS